MSCQNCESEKLVAHSGEIGWEPQRAQNPLPTKHNADMFSL